MRQSTQRDDSGEGSEPSREGAVDGVQSGGNGTTNGSNGDSDARVDVDRESQTDSVVVGIPTYNEEVGIGSIVLEAHDYAHEVIVIDDGSADRTVEVAHKAGATVVHHEANKGKGAAFRTLLTHVRQRDYELDALVVLDGDGQHVPRDIPDVAAPVLAGETDMTIGSRYVGGGETETPTHRRVGQQVLDYMTLGSSGRKLSDTQSGFRAFSPEAVEQLNIRTDGMGVESEMIGDASEKGLEIQEVPIDVRYEGIDGQTHNPVAHGLGVGSFILQLMRDRHPLVFFGLPAVFLLTLGGMVGIYSAVVFHETGVFHQWRFLGSGFVVLLGTLCLFCGLVLSQVRNMIRNLDE